MIAREPLNVALFGVDTDAENERRVDERVNWPVERLIQELVRGGEEVQGLLSQLGEDDLSYGGGGSPISLHDFLRAVQDEHHDLIHLSQLRDALKA